MADPPFHIGGGTGSSGGASLGKITQAIGSPLREISDTEPSVAIKGYGGVGFSGSDSMSTINTSWQTLEMDTAILPTPVDVTQDTAGDGIRINVIGTWQFNAFIHLEFDDENSGKEIKFRAFNATELSAFREFTFFVGRNQGGINAQVTLLADIVTGDIGDLIVLQVSSTLDTFANPVNKDSLFEVVREG